MKKISTYLFIAVFFLLCLIPSAGMLVWGESEAGANEVLSPAPSWTERDGSFNMDVLSDFADYMADRFAFRQALITGWARLNAALFHTSTAEDVILGSDDWLYFAPTLDDYTGAEPMTDRELWTAARTLFLMQEYTESRGGSFLFTIAPNKNSLYGENMPEFTILSEEHNAGRLAALLADMGVSYCDLFKGFDETEEILYFKGDSHWNAKGAALAADRLMAGLGLDAPGYYQGGFVAGEPHLGDLYEMLYPAGRETEADYARAEGFSFAYTSKATDADAITLSTVKEGAVGSLLMYRDSFGRNLYPYLADCFGETLFSRKNVYDLTLLPDGGCAVVELVERNLRYLNTYAPTFPAPARELNVSDATVIMAYCGTFTQESGAPEGCVKLRGDLTGLTVDADSPVYVQWDGAVYEATPSPEGFSLTLEGGAVPETLPVSFYQNGILVTAFADYEA